MAKERIKNRGECERLESGDMTACLDLIIDSAIRINGHPATYPNTRQGLEDFITKCIDYFEEVKVLNERDEISRDIVPDVEGLCIYLGISRMTLSNYVARGGEWAKTIQYFKDCILSVKKSLAYAYKVPPVLMIFDLCNNHGYESVNKITVSQDTALDDSTDTTQAEIERNGLEWDDTTKAYRPRKPFLLEDRIDDTTD